MKNLCLFLCLVFMHANYANQVSNVARARQFWQNIDRQAQEQAGQTIDTASQEGHVAELDNDATVAGQFAQVPDDVDLVTTDWLEPQDDVNNLQTRGPQQPALHSLITKKQDKIAKKFIQDPSVDLNEKNQQGATPLYVAVSKRNDTLVKAILAQAGRVNINERNGRNNRTALMQAYLIGEDKIFKRLVRAGADVNIVDKAGNTVLHAAADRGSKDDVVYLLKHGAEKNVTNNKNQKPVDFARVKGKRSIVRLLEGN